MLTDTHCHLDLEKFDTDRTSVLLRAEQAGITRILIPGLTLISSRSVVELAESHPMLYAAVGIHPTEASEFEQSALNEFRSLAQHPKVKAIGEIGLDYYWDTAPHDIQQRVLEEQLGLAADLQLPVVLHFREKGDLADGPCASKLLEMLEEWTGGLRRGKNPLAEHPGVLHSFSGSQATAEKAINLGFYLGVTGPVTYNKVRQEVIASLPLKSLLVETDSPFLSPAPRRGTRNEPANIRLIADKIAALYSCNPEEAAAITTDNAKKLFRWDD
jgi:TatD DNase family protein